ncbi:hypothetical protein NC653_026629 [Populus alba x Populus x berolinensis]|uniref:Uncharacterized protein n=1 Tax=Populus alba x Populus x berolinensis TaxID=444605 RepID=A0AAD6ME40_9ROSI|nr:hypothetical protein NC653_026629 [Populus alba x Populus x berolinensis]
MCAKIALRVWEGKDVGFPGDELERHEDNFEKLAIHLLSEYKKELEPSISRIEKICENPKEYKVEGNVGDGI